MGIGLPDVTISENKYTAPTSLHKLHFKKDLKHLFSKLQNDLVYLQIHKKVIIFELPKKNRIFNALFSFFLFLGLTAVKRQATLVGWSLSYQPFERALFFVNYVMGIFSS